VNINNFEWPGQILVSWLDECGARPGLYGRFWNTTEWQPAECLFDGWGVRTVTDNLPATLEVHLASHTVPPTCPCNDVLYASGMPGAWSTPEAIGSGHTIGEWEWPQEVVVHVTSTNVPHAVWRHETYDNQLQLVDERLIHAAKDGSWVFDDAIAVNRDSREPMIGTNSDGTPAVVWCDDSRGSFDIYLATQAPLIGIAEGSDQAPAPGLIAMVAPNPTRRQAAIDVISATSGPLRVRIYDAQSRLVAALGREVVSPGRTQVVWSGRTISGKSVPAGTYYLRVETGGDAVTERLVVLR
jgi:hypothetical protein